MNKISLESSLLFQLILFYFLRECDRVENIISMIEINNIFLYSLSLFKSVVALCQTYHFLMSWLVNGEKFILFLGQHPYFVSFYCKWEKYNIPIFVVIFTSTYLKAVNGTTNCMYCRLVCKIKSYNLQKNINLVVFRETWEQWGSSCWSETAILSCWKKWFLEMASIWRVSCSRSCLLHWYCIWG